MASNACDWCSSVSFRTAVWWAAAGALFAIATVIALVTT